MNKLILLLVLFIAVARSAEIVGSADVNFIAGPFGVFSCVNAPTFSLTSVDIYADNVDYDQSLASQVPSSGLEIFIKAEPGHETLLVNFTDGTNVLVYENVVPEYCLDAILNASQILDQSAQDTTYDILVLNFVTSKVDGDPHFYPLNREFKNMKYSPAVNRSGVYNIFTNHLLQWNSEWTIYDTVKTLARPQFLTQHGFTIRNKENNKITKVQVRTETDDAKEKTLRLVIEYLNERGEWVELKKKQHHLFGKQFPSYQILQISENYVVVSAPFFKALIKPAFVADSSPKFSYPYLDTSFDADPSLTESHGFLGQTLRKEAPYRTPHMNCVACWVRYPLSDYWVKEQTLYGSNFRYNLF